MDDQHQHIKFRGGPVAGFILAVAFSAVLLNRFVPTFLPDYSGVGAPSPAAVGAMGCMDHEAAAILANLHAHAFAEPLPGSEAASAFVAARASGLSGAGNIEMLKECRDRLVDSSPSLATKGNISSRVDEISASFVEFYAARALTLSIEFEAIGILEGELVFSDTSSSEAHAAARNDLAEGWVRAETSINGLSEWIGDVLIRE